tara:strand:+ start:249 stop:1121 length:873 start_codon:yes stop_codon:yes gene_type:complete
MKIIILIPVYNDWQSLFKLLQNINSEVDGLNKEFSIFVVNDASTENKPQFYNNFNNLKSIKIINMKENRGHARCIAVGLKYILENENFDFVIPMDGDGEDNPEEIKQFIDNLNYHPDKPIVGERIKRSESIFFQFCYFIHKLITFVFSGETIKYGNYTCLPKSIVEKMINEKATWSSFSGSLAKIAKERASIPSARGTRYFGPSKMNFLNLIKHSFSIIAVFKLAVVLRSTLFVIIYFFLVHQNISTIMLLPIIFVIVMIISIFIISKRENIAEFRNSLKNILVIEELKK